MRVCVSWLHVFSKWKMYMSVPLVFVENVFEIPWRISNNDIGDTRIKSKRKFWEYSFSLRLTLSLSRMPCPPFSILANHTLTICRLFYSFGMRCIIFSMFRCCLPHTIPSCAHDIYATCGVDSLQICAPNGIHIASRQLTQIHNGIQFRKHTNVRIASYKYNNIIMIDPQQQQQEFPQKIDSTEMGIHDDLARVLLFNGCTAIVMQKIQVEIKLKT